MHLPSSTYRLQLHKDFTLRSLQRIVDYLHTLGISTVYASPVMRAVPGSAHGYDVTDPHQINPELGQLDDLCNVVRELHKRDMFWLQDIVPNHMAFHTDNWRLMDVFERGPLSPYYHYFDIDWDHPHPALKGRVMVPVLGKTLEECIEGDELKLAYTDGAFEVRYFETAWPLSLPGYRLIETWIRRHEADNPVAAVISRMVSAAEGAGYETWRESKAGFLHAIRQLPEQEVLLRDLASAINRDTTRFRELLDAMYYRPFFWKDADQFINYRRFFTVNELICLRMEDDPVFEDYHQVLLRLYREKVISGFRIDHIDGLNDPARYTQQLREEVGDACYIIAEKILEGTEDFPHQWPVQGTSGYEFLSHLSQLLTHRKGARQLLAFYRELVPELPAYSDLILQNKRNILSHHLRGEWDNLLRLFYNLGLDEGQPSKRMRTALGYLMASLPVYRIYPDQLPLRGENLVTFHEAFDRALTIDHSHRDELLYLRGLFTDTPRDAVQAARILRFLKRMMQFTGPLTAKGVEDTTFYVYNPLISHDEVGDSPESLGMSVETFHARMKHRQEHTPYSLNTTATHDTKRGEDARIRINVLSRMPDEWQSRVREWREVNAEFRKNINGKEVPSTNDEYLIYQAMIGGFPENFSVDEEWIGRFLAYLVKASREAKVHTNWSEPDEAYEEACAQFVSNILRPEHTFLNSFVPFVKMVVEQATVYALVQTLVKLTAPGIPDVYQGCELWDLSFVDPDNRRPVDYEKRMGLLFQLVVKEEGGWNGVAAFLREHRQVGVEKLFVTWKTLTFRRANPQLFVEGQYVPLAVTGDKGIAAGYARHYDGQWIAVVFPLGSITHQNLFEDAGPDPLLIFPDEAPDTWVNRFTGEEYEQTHQIPLRLLFQNFPVALLTARHDFVSKG